MKWLGNPNRHFAREVNDLSHSPSGGRLKLILLGLLVPLIVSCFAVRAWVTEEAIWFGRHNSDTVVHGGTAKCLAITWLSVGLFCYFRYFWGLVPGYRAYEIGTIVSLLGILIGLSLGTYYFFR